MLPCSRVGHVFRPRFPYSFPARPGSDLDVVSRNLMRVADVWMDDYAKHFYNIRFDLKKKKHDDVSERLALKERLKCKSFKWYLENVIPEMEIPDTNYLQSGQVSVLYHGEWWQFSRSYPFKKLHPLINLACPIDMSWGKISCFFSAWLVNVHGKTSR